MEVPLQPLVHDTGAAVGRLTGLGLSAEDFAFVLRGADAEARMWTPLAPPVMPGIARWGKTNELLRVRLLPRGWSHDNPKNLPRTISPTGDFAIVGTTGDAATGFAGGKPTTRYPQGRGDSARHRAQRLARLRLRRARRRGGPGRGSGLGRRPGHLAAAVPRGGRADPRGTLPAGIDIAMRVRRHLDRADHHSCRRTRRHRDHSRQL